MASAIARAYANDPVMRGMLRKAGLQAVRALGRSRATRNAQGQWYLGRRIGAPASRTSPNTGRNSKRFQKGARVARQLATVTTNALVTNTGQSVTNQQPATKVWKQGTESVAELKINASQVVNDWGTAYSQSANIADPGFLAGLSAIANQYQQFRIKSFKFTFTPSATSTTNGTIYLGFTPDCNAADPTNEATMSGYLATENGPFFGKVTTLNVPAQCLQQAYNVQTVAKSKTALDTTQQSPGKFYVGFTGAGTIPTGGVSIGVVRLTYAVELLTPQVKQGSNTLEGTYEPVDGTFSSFVLTDEDLTSGWHMLMPTEIEDNVYRFRIRGARHLVVLESTAAAAHPGMTVNVSTNADSWTTLEPVFIETTATHGLEVYEVPPTRFVRLGNTSSIACTDCKVRVVSLPD